MCHENQWTARGFVMTPINGKRLQKTLSKIFDQERRFPLGEGSVPEGQDTSVWNIPRQQVLGPEYLQSRPSPCGITLWPVDKHYTDVIISRLTYVGRRLSLESYSTLGSEDSWRVRRPRRELLNSAVIFSVVPNFLLALAETEVKPDRVPARPTTSAMVGHLNLLSGLALAYYRARRYFDTNCSFSDGVENLILLEA